MSAPVLDGEALGDGLVVGLLVGDEDGETVEVTGCGVVSDGVGVGCAT
jgi:hypothetical protein